VDANIEPERIPKPYRIMMMGAPLDQFFLLSEEQKERDFLPGFKRMLANWERLGAEVVASITDDLLTVGAPRSLDYVWFQLFDVQSLDTVAAMINEVRKVEDGIRLDRYIRWEARIGRPFYAREEKWVTQPAETAETTQAD
jgi:hypothetical protein